MKTLHIGEKPPIDGARFSMDLETHRRYQEQDAEIALNQKRAACIGTFKTGLRCNCRRCEISDCATEHDPDRRISPLEVRYGPQTTAREQFAAFRVYHRYVCEECGALYVGRVIEGKRGYIPRERRP